LRLFIAVSLPAPERARIRATAERLEATFPDARWTAEEALHVTVRFLGAVESDRLGDVTAALDAVARRHGGFAMTIGGPGAFPDARRPQILWLGVNDGGALARVAASLDRSLRPLGFAAEGRPFTPHVTLARRRRGAAPAMRRGGLPACDFRATVQVTTLDLMRSHTDRGGARYERLHAARLGGEGT
jgi:RNA 2',3'-cyclic 3'-phosphodiesterase